MLTRNAGAAQNRAMSRGLWVWKLKLCLAALAAMVASAVVPQRAAHEQQQLAKDMNTKGPTIVDNIKPTAVAPVQMQAPRPPAATDTRDRLAVSL
jgi:hypothetical protein